MTNALVPWSPAALILRDAITPSLFDIGTTNAPEPSFPIAPLYPANSWYVRARDLGESIFVLYPKGIYISFLFDLNVRHGTFGRTLMENAIIQAMSAEGRGTAAPQEICLYWRHPLERGRESLERSPSERSRARIGSQTAAQKLIGKIQSRSGLTLEEIAPLVGVTRRSLQHWRAGRQISARKEQLLRDMVDTLDALPFIFAQDIRQKLFERDTGSIRPYDLLAEGRFDAAYTMITKCPAPAHLSQRTIKFSLPAVPSLVARLSGSDDGPPLSNHRVDLRRSGRLKR